MSFAVGAVVATIHDLLVTLAFLAFFRYELSLLIAAILTVTGYSTNDTIVIFDRVRENLRGMRREYGLNDVINVSLGIKDARPNGAHGGYDAAERGCYLFGGEVLRGFAFTMIVGVITGTYSSVFVAAAIVTFWRGQGPTKAAAHAPASDLPAGAAPHRERRNNRRASRSRSGKPRRRHTAGFRLQASGSSLTRWPRDEARSRKPEAGSLFHVHSL